ncbi:hypothetical protein EWM64_g8843 [Hericium alpestre]|uniref:Uncharacterized protein n=1 Tax=Hericium alpestre TaxID=135208 RepID=A0A4Y9ZLN2_9AGAM|nr:hypothetical protein EWM64_g8843 [Hericium alpestre]
MNLIFRCFIPLVPILAASSVAAAAPIVPDSPCAISFNGYALHSLHLNPYDIRNVPLLLAAVADSLPPGFALTRAQDELRDVLHDLGLLLRRHRREPLREAHFAWDGMGADRRAGGRGTYLGGRRGGCS